MDWFRKVMAGRYGSDQLAIALIVVSLLLGLVSSIVGISALLYISYVPLILSIFRIFSKNINKRRMENYKFAMLISPLYAWSIKKVKKLQDSKTHKYFKCPSCKSQLRVPRGKGKVSISCPKCRNEFFGKA